MPIVGGLAYFRSMKKSIRLVSSVCAVAVVLFGLISIADVAYAQDSVTIPGQVTVDQCPSGFQYSVGIEARIGVGMFTICYAAPNAADVLKQQQDQDFQNRIQLATAAAQAESEAWNKANPGQQKCVQWGPVVHANGVSTASGGACANVVQPEAPAASIETDPIVDNSVLPTRPALTAILPFTVELAGQHSAADCPVGYQAANGLSVNATTGVVTTACWSSPAWQAQRIGGDTWANFVASGGTYNPQVAADKEAAIAALKARARATAQAAADATPGTKRCTTWTGFGSTGTECAYSFIDPANGAHTQANPATPAPSATPSATPDPNNSAQPGATPPVTTSSLKISYVSKTKSVCTVSAGKVLRKSAGTCLLSVTVVKPSGVMSTSLKKIVFTK